MQRLTEAQRKTAKSLIKEICANYDRAENACLRLGSEPCPQMLGAALCCKYFRDIVLEDKRALQLKTELGRSSAKRCEQCGQRFYPLSNRGKYCPACSENRRKQRQREYMREKRS